MVNVAFAVNTDYCSGCQTCQVACREINRVPFEERWLEVRKGAPTCVDGRLRLHYSHVPELDKCIDCVEQVESPYCQEVCPSHCLFVGERDGVLACVLDSKDKWSVVFGSM